MQPVYINSYCFYSRGYCYSGESPSIYPANEPGLQEYYHKCRTTEAHEPESSKMGVACGLECISTLPSGKSTCDHHRNRTRMPGRYREVLEYNH